jgi:hypothetical protein
MASTIPSVTLLLSSKLSVPQHVVYRSFPTETVVLNLQTGRYHGLNATAGAMLDALAQAGTVREAITVVAESYDQPHEVVEKDICGLCQALLERGLVEIDGSPAG